MQSAKNRSSAISLVEIIAVQMLIVTLQFTFQRSTHTKLRSLLFGVSCKNSAGNVPMSQGAERNNIKLAELVVC